MSAKLTAIETLSIREICGASNVSDKWVISDRQLADILTKQGVLTDNLDCALKSNEWRIIYDAPFTSAKNLRKQARSGHFRKMQTASNEESLLTLEFAGTEVAHILGQFQKHKPKLVKSTLDKLK